MALLPSIEFSHTHEFSRGSRNIPVGVHEAETVKQARQIPELGTAFLQWLEHRKPAIDAYKEKQSVYPIFFAAAQGGGIYAAAHPAMVLARLVDSCPEFAHHLFGIASVSGGGLGAAVFAELLRAIPDESGGPTSPIVGCSAWRKSSLEQQIYKFFSHDFLSPVVANALLFGVPGVIVPPLALIQDRAKALENAFEAAWSRLSLPSTTGLNKEFYGRWDPRSREPALFMSTTSVALGIPVLVSQIDWAINPPPRTINKSDFIRSTGTPRDRQSIANILDFRPDLQLRTSTAIGLSARFPFVTPPGSLHANPRITRSQGPFQEATVLQLTDGGFYDNGGVAVSRDLLVQLQLYLTKDERFASFRDKVQLHLILFTNLSAARQLGPDVGNSMEWIAPIVAFESVRQARSAIAVTMPDSITSHSVALLDEWYDEYPLTWLLSHQGKLAINRRSSWFMGADNTVCCEVIEPATGRKTAIKLTADEVHARKKEGYDVKPFVPNQTALLEILHLVDLGNSKP